MYTDRYLQMFQIVNPGGDGSIFLSNVSKFLLRHTIEDTVLLSHSQFSIIHVYGHIKLLCMDFDV